MEAQWALCIILSNLFLEHHIAAEFNVIFQWFAQHENMYSPPMFPVIIVSGPFKCLCLVGM